MSEEKGDQSMAQIPEKYPKADLRHFGKVHTDGVFHGGPLGVTVHYTAGRGIDGTVQSLVESDLGYHLLIGRDGTVFQLASTRFKLWHAGKAAWNGLSPNASHVAICFESWGELQRKDG